MEQVNFTFVDSGPEFNQEDRHSDVTEQVPSDSGPVTASRWTDYPDVVVLRRELERQEQREFDREKWIRTLESNIEERDATLSQQRAAIARSNDSFGRLEEEAVEYRNERDAIQKKLNAAESSYNDQCATVELFMDQRTQLRRELAIHCAWLKALTGKDLPHENE